MNFWGMGLKRSVYKSFIFDQAKLYDLVKNNKKLLPKSKLLGDDIYFRIKNFLNFPKKLIYNDLKFQINCILQSKYTISPKKSLIINDGFDGSGANCLYDNKNFFNSNYSQKIKFKNISLNYNNKKIVKIIRNRFKLNSKDKFWLFSVISPSYFNDERWYVLQILLYSILYRLYFLLWDGL